jgi:hypothetical protein
LAAGQHDGVHQPAVVTGRAHRARHDRGAAEVGGEVAGALAFVPSPIQRSGRTGDLRRHAGSGDDQRLIIPPCLPAFAGCVGIEQTTSSPQAKCRYLGRRAEEYPQIWE